MNEILNQLFTGKDNKTYDLGRVSWAICLVAVIGFAIYQIAIDKSFSLREFGETIGAVVGVHSAGIWAKRDTEPNIPDQEDISK